MKWADIRTRCEDFLVLVVSRRKVSAYYAYYAHKPMGLLRVRRLQECLHVLKSLVVEVEGFRLR